MSVCLAGIRFIFGAAEFGSERVSNYVVRSGKGERDRAMAMRWMDRWPLKSDRRHVGRETDIEEGSGGDDCNS